MAIKRLIKPGLTALVVLVAGGGLGFLAGRNFPYKVLEQDEAVALMEERISVRAAAGTMRTGDDLLQATGPLFRSMKKATETAAQKATLGNAHFRYFEPDPSYEQYEPLLVRNDLLGRIAFGRIMQMDYRAYDKPEAVRDMLIEFRDRFSPSPLDIWYSSVQVRNFAADAATEEDFETAAEIVLAEARRMPTDAPYWAYTLLMNSIEWIDKAGRSEEAFSLLTEKRAGLSARLSEIRSGRQPEQWNDLLALAPKWYWLSQDVLYGQSLWQAHEAKIADMLNDIDDFLTEHRGSVH